MGRLLSPKVVDPFVTTGSNLQEPIPPAFCYCCFASRSSNQCYCLPFFHCSARNSGHWTSSQCWWWSNPANHWTHKEKVLDNKNHQLQLVHQIFVISGVSSDVTFPNNSLRCTSCTPKILWFEWPRTEFVTIVGQRSSKLAFDGTWPPEVSSCFTNKQCKFRITWYFCTRTKHVLWNFFGKTETNNPSNCTGIDSVGFRPQSVRCFWSWEFSALNGNLVRFKIGQLRSCEYLRPQFSNLKVSWRKLDWFLGLCYELRWFSAWCCWDFQNHHWKQMFQAGVLGSLVALSLIQSTG